MTPIRLLLLVLALALAASSRADLPATIERVKPAVIIVGKYRETDNPRFSLGGAGFVVGDGHLAVTNAHVLERLPDAQVRTSLAVQVRAGDAWELRQATLLDVDPPHDLALLRIDGAALPALALGDSDAVREGKSIAFTGFPIGGALG
ncbi:MAG TPA: serine protease, partial [Burkholderiaceae bacterium]